MKTTVHKYVLHSDREYISVPKGAIFLSAQSQHGKIVVYTKEDFEELTFVKYEVIKVITGGSSTGEYDLSNYNYLGTVMLSEGFWVEHIFFRRIWEEVIFNG